MKSVIRIYAWAIAGFFLSCESSQPDQGLDVPIDPLSEALVIDPSTGIPYAITFQHPISGYDTFDYGFGFAQQNSRFCVTIGSAGECLGYGHHLGRDTIPGKTPVGTIVRAPADGIVRITTNIDFGAYGSDDVSIKPYRGCVIVLEHLLKNKQAVTSLLGHVQCESQNGYQPESHQGNPRVGDIVRRGQYVGHVADYWSGTPEKRVNWHHLHWAMGKGRFAASAYTLKELSPYVRGYAPRSEFSRDPETSASIHAKWLDPFLVVAANGDPVAQANANVRSHPSGSLLQDQDGRYWMVAQHGKIHQISSEIFIGDRYDSGKAISVSDDEINCYHQAEPMVSLGHVTLYVRPGTNTVVMAYDQAWQRFDVIRWEALLSWNYDDVDLIDQASASFYETSYSDHGFRMLRPGSLVKAEDASEVAIVTAEQRRLPIVSGTVFEHAGFRWEHVVSLPASVLDAVAGTRMDRPFTVEDLQACVVQASCPGGEMRCGGGGGVTECIPGSWNACWCSTGMEGEQQCAQDGASFLPCDCSSSHGSNERRGGEEQETPHCIPGAFISCTCDQDRKGAQECMDDGRSFGACICESQNENSGSPMSPPHDDPLHLQYQSPTAGELSIQGWWRNPDGSTRPWGNIPCLDPDATDDLLECDLPVPSGASAFEFQVFIPDSKYWGDHSCISGGCNHPLGALMLTAKEMTLVYTFVPNGTGPLYYNGYLMFVP